MKNADVLGEWLKHRMWSRRMARVELEIDNQIRLVLVYDAKNFEPFEWSNSTAVSFQR